MSGPALSPLVAAVIDRRFPTVDRAAIGDILMNDCGSNLPLATDAALIERIRLASFAWQTVVLPPCSTTSGQSKSTGGM